MNTGTHASVVNQVLLDTSKGTNGFSVDATHAAAGCSAADFRFDALPLTVDASVAPGSPLTIGPGSSDGTGGGVRVLWLSDSGVNQDACQGATVTAYDESN